MAVGGGSNEFSVDCPEASGQRKKRELRKGSRAPPMLPLIFWFGRRRKGKGGGSAVTLESTTERHVEATLLSGMLPLEKLGTGCSPVGRWQGSNRERRRCLRSSEVVERTETSWWGRWLGRGDQPRRVTLDGGGWDGTTLLDVSGRESRYDLPARSVQSTQCWIY